MVWGSMYRRSWPSLGAAAFLFASGVAWAGVAVLLTLWLASFFLAGSAKLDANYQNSAK